jgi:hypothetical protein
MKWSRDSSKYSHVPGWIELNHGMPQDISCSTWYSRRNRRNTLYSTSFTVWANSICNINYNVAKSVQWLRFGLDDPGLESRQEQYRPIFSPRNLPQGTWGPPSLLLKGYRGSFPGIKQSDREADHSSTSSAEVQNEWRYISAPPTCLNGVERDKFNFTFYNKSVTFYPIDIN